MRRSSQRLTSVALAAVAVLATFGIGVLVGRELRRPPTAAPADPSLGYDLAPYSSVAPELLAYAVLLEIPLDLEQARGIASTHNGTLYVCGDRTLLAVDRTGAAETRWDLDGDPSCLALGPEGRVYVGMQDHVEVVETETGNRQSWPDLGPQAIVTSIAVVGSSVFVADAGNRMVLRFDDGGKLAGTIGTGYAVPSPYFDLAAAPDGTLWVADPGHRRLQHFTPAGTLLGAWGRSSLDIDGFGGCCNPAHIAVLPCGALVTSEKGLPRVKLYEPDGKLAAVVAQPADFPPGTAGLDLATRKANGGEILVLVPEKRVVRVYVKKEVVSRG